MADISIFWFLPPAVAAISLVYSGTRFETWPFILGYAVRWALYILTFLAGAWVFLFLLGTHNRYLAPVAILGLLVFLFGGSFKRKKASEADPDARAS
jgi:hypothetical protein